MSVLQQLHGAIDRHWQMVLAALLDKVQVWPTQATLKTRNLAAYLISNVGPGRFPESPETPEITQILENFMKVTKHFTKLKETLTNYVWEKSHLKKQ